MRRGGCKKRYGSLTTIEAISGCHLFDKATEYGRNAKKKGHLVSFAINVAAGMQLCIVLGMYPDDVDLWECNACILVTR